MNPLPCILTVQGSGFFVGNCYFDHLKEAILRKITFSATYYKCLFVANLGL